MWTKTWLPSKAMGQVWLSHVEGGPHENNYNQHGTLIFIPLPCAKTTMQGPFMIWHGKRKGKKQENIVWMTWTRSTYKPISYKKQSFPSNHCLQIWESSNRFQYVGFVKRWVHLRCVCVSIVMLSKQCDVSCVNFNWSETISLFGRAYWTMGKEARKWHVYYVLKWKSSLHKGLILLC
jgi:hypothetical protein